MDVTGVFEVKNVTLGASNFNYISIDESLSQDIKTVFRLLARKDCKLVVKHSAI